MTPLMIAGPNESRNRYGGESVGPPPIVDHIIYAESVLMSTHNSVRIFTFHHDTSLALIGNSLSLMVLPPQINHQLNGALSTPSSHQGAISSASPSFLVIVFGGWIAQTSPHCAAIFPIIQAIDRQSTSPPPSPPSQH